MPLTPGIASALLVSMLVTRACGMRAEQQLAEQHAVDAEVFGVLGLAGDLRDEVRRGVVLADEFVSAMVSLSHHLSAVHQRGENLVVVLAAAQIAGDAVRQLLRASGSGWS